MNLALRNPISTEEAAERLDRLDWQRVSQELDEYGDAPLPRILSTEDCDARAALYLDDTHFRSRVVMEGYRLGRGEHKYFRYPLPEIISDRRTTLYPHLAEVANQWNQGMSRISG